MIISVAFSITKNLLAIGSWLGSIRIIDLQTYQ